MTPLEAIRNYRRDMIALDYPFEEIRDLVLSIDKSVRHDNAKFYAALQEDLEARRQMEKVTA